MSPVFYLTVAIFACTYAVIITEKVHSTVVALAGASLLILLGVLSQEEAIHGVDFNTIGLLIGMMMIVSIGKHSGIFQYIALSAAKLGKGDPKLIFFAFGFIAAIFSALLDNVTTVLLMVPVTFVITNNLKLNPKPFLFNTILLSNIGGAATLIGDPPNILIGSAANISFNDFLFNLGPLSLLITVCVSFGLYAIYRKQLVVSEAMRARVMAFNPKAAITNKSLLIKSIFVMVLVLIGFITHSHTHLQAATLALAGAALLLLLTLDEPEEYLKEVEWTTIFFFIGLFILVTGLEKVGAIYLLAEKLLHVTGGDPTLTTIGILWASGIFSAVVNNIPFVATMIPLIQDVGALSGIPLEPLWWALAIGVDFGGNATIVGASANLVVAGMAEKDGHRIGFFEYVKVAVPVTFAVLVLSTFYIVIRYL